MFPHVAADFYQRRKENSMTKDEFQDSYYEYMTSDGAAAKAEAAKVNATGIDGDSAIAVQFGDLWCLMLKDAYDFTRVLGIDSAT